MLKQGSGSSGGFTVLGKGSIPWTQPRNVFVIVRFTEYFWWMKCIRCIPDSSCYAINDGREFVNPSADEQWHGDKCLFSPRLAEAWEFPTEHTCQSTIFVVVWKHPPWLLSNKYVSSCKIRSVRSRRLDCRDIYEIRAAIPFFWLRESACSSPFQRLSVSWFDTVTLNSSTLLGDIYNAQI